MSQFRNFNLAITQPLRHACLSLHETCPLEFEALSTGAKICHPPAILLAMSIILNSIESILDIHSSITQPAQLARLSHQDVSCLEFYALSSGAKIIRLVQDFWKMIQFLHEGDKID